VNNEQVVPDRIMAPVPKKYFTSREIDGDVKDDTASVEKQTSTAKEYDI